ncbi:hypothetical protein DFH94DRAFT_786580 [Russula ochroleuca]|uniref:Uncharacterized protein n=1 Tax=Russula ochroleuca TaxID=152965 RepID=A0A9P5MPX2_9AGAM|nr:hypothetical protein DFH94DRAFT_786580 [Russula ochroleuca]
MHAAPHIDISAAEQVSLHELTVPELSPSDPTSNASSPSSSVPVTPLDPPPFSATQPDPLVHGKHQPDPQPFRPVSKSAPRGLGTVWRARQVLLGLGKRKRRASADISISTGVELLTDYYDVPELPDSNSAPEITEPRHSQSLFSLPNIPIDSTPHIAQARPPIMRRHSTYDTDTLPSAPASPVPAVTATERTLAPAPGSPWAPPGLSLPLISRVILFLPWCVAVGAAIALYPRALSSLVRIYAGSPRTPLHRLAHHAHTARAHLGIFLGVLSLLAAALPSWRLRVVLVGAVVARAVVVWRGFGARMLLLERRRGEDVEEEWREDARCVWRVLRGEEEREILRACGGEGMLKVE